MGHELGHYVLNHVSKSLLFFGVLRLLLFAVLFQGSRWAVSRWGARWRVEGVEDVAVLPVLGTIVVGFVLLTTPLVNTHIRTQEHEADIFGLNASRQPDGHAAIELKLADYRKLEPSRLEELIFLDHPSGRDRILAAMRWKEEHLAE